MWDYGERCWTKVSSVWIFLRFSGLMGFRFPREYVRDGPGFFFSIIKTNWRYRFLHDCSPLVGRLLVAACCIAYITLIEVRFLLPTKSFFIVFSCFIFPLLFGLSFLFYLLFLFWKIKKNWISKCAPSRPLRWNIAHFFCFPCVWCVLPSLLVSQKQKIWEGTCRIFHPIIIHKQKRKKTKYLERKEWKSLLHEGVRPTAKEEEDEGAPASH